MTSFSYLNSLKSIAESLHCFCFIFIKKNNLIQAILKNITLSYFKLLNNLQSIHFKGQTFFLIIGIE